MLRIVPALTVQPIGMHDRGKLSIEDFESSCRILFDRTINYNIKHPESQINLRLVSSPSDAVSNTASIYLCIDEDIQIHYSPTFQVPIFYLDATLAPSDPFFTKGSYTEHPISGLPCVYLHPCNTASVMEELVPDFGGKDDYLGHWLAVYQRMIPNLSLPNEFFRDLLFINKDDNIL